MIMLWIAMIFGDIREVGEFIVAYWASHGEAE